MPETSDAKRELRRAMGAVRRAASSDPHRSAALVDRLERELAAARTVMMFDPVPGEPDLASLADRLRARGVVVVVPAPDPDARVPAPPATVDAVVVPGVAFTRRGDRLGRGGGWYDRFLAGVRPDCTVVGVCFDEQVVELVPTEPHDVAVAAVVTPTATYRRADADDPGAGAPGSS